MLQLRCQLLIQLRLIRKSYLLWVLSYLNCIRSTVLQALSWLHSLVLWHLTVVLISCLVLTGDEIVNVLDDVLVVFGDLFAEVDVVFGYLFLASFGRAFRPVAAFDSYLIGCRLAPRVEPGDGRGYADLLAL